MSLLCGGVEREPASGETVLKDVDKTAITYVERQTSGNDMDLVEFSKMLGRLSVTVKELKKLVEAHARTTVGIKKGIETVDSQVDVMGGAYVKVGGIFGG